MRFKTHQKITLLFGSLVAVVLFGLYFYLDHVLKIHTYHRIDANLVQELALARSYVERVFESKPSPEAIDATADQIGKDLNVRATIIGLDGKVLGDSSFTLKELGQLENHLNRPEVQEARKKGSGISHRYSSSVREGMSYAAVPFGRPKSQGFLRISVALSEISMISSRLEKLLWVSIIFSLVLFLGVSFLASVIITKPIERISRVAQDIAGGDFSKKALVESHDEIADLAKAIDFMSQEISRRIDEVTAAKGRLEAVFLSMTEGVMVVSGDGRIVLMNETLKKILRVEHEPAGRRPLEVIRNVEVQDIVERVLQKSEGTETREMTFLLPEEKVLRVHAAPVRAENATEGAVLVFHDITDLRRLETIRKDFVANVSHELRTPVASIKGYAETLLEGAIEDKVHNREFLKIIYTESDRLAKLVDDLLELARLESGKSTLSFKACRIKDIFDWVIAGLSKQAQERSIGIEARIPANLSPVRADESAVAQIFLNLIQNALKYNKPNGSITVSAREKGDMVEVSVSDTGIGIPPEDLSRVFERFYRVDKARSRELGGTGLGLSIVKHIVQAHGGEVSVESELGQGSTFRFSIPKNE